jgi:trk system potassium uptake protein TrkA
MYIIVAGGGMVGGELVRRLVENKHDVVVIEQDKEVCNKLYSETGAIAINGNAARAEILKEAGVDKADVVVAATGNDADNLACAILAKSFGVPQIIIRMRNPDYENAYKLVGVTSIVHVTDLMVNQMIVEIEKPKVRRVMTIGGGKAHIYSVIIPQGAKIAGEKVEDIARNPKFPPQCVFIAMYNHETNELSIPRGQQVIDEGDELFLISTAEDIKKVADFLTS